MGLYERFPYVNEHGRNYDWLLEMVKKHEDRIEKLEADYINIVSRLEIVEGSITNIQEQIRIINNIIEGLDLTEIYNLIRNVNNQSIARDEDLARRIALLEQAVINPINEYLGTENLILWGSDYRYLPDNAIGENGLPLGIKCGKTANSDESDRCIKYTNYGLTANDEYSRPTGTANYRYITIGAFSDQKRSSNNLTQNITVTVGVANTQNTYGTPTVYSSTFAALNANQVQEWAGNLNMRLSYNSTEKKIIIDLRGSGSDFCDALTNKYITYIRVEYGNESSGLRYNDHDGKIANAIALNQGQLTPSDVKLIVAENLREIMDTEEYADEFNVTLTPRDGSASYSVDARLDFRLQKTAGYLSGIMALNIPFSTQTKDLDFTKTFEVNVDISRMDIPKKTIDADTIHFFTDLFTGAQFNLVLSNGEGTIVHPSSKLCYLRFWGAMAPITVENNGMNYATLGVIKIFEPCDWYLTPPI